MSRERTTFKTITFDLFGTLVKVDDGRLPRLNIHGMSVPSLLAAPFGRLHELVPTLDLADFLVCYVQVAAEIGARRGVAGERESRPWTQLARCLERVGVADEALARELARSQMQATLQAARAVEGACSLLDRLRDRGCTLGLISNLADACGGAALLSQLRLASYFDAVVFSGDVGWRKPDRRMFETALSALHVSAPAVLHVGDELRADILGAGRCGLSTVWLNPGGERFEGEHPPLLNINELAGLADAGLTP